MLNTKATDQTTVNWKNFSYYEPVIPRETRFLCLHPYCYVYDDLPSFLTMPLNRLWLIKNVLTVVLNRHLENLRHWDGPTDRKSIKSTRMDVENMITLLYKILSYQGCFVTSKANKTAAHNCNVIYDPSTWKPQSDLLFANLVVFWRPI